MYIFRLTKQENPNRGARYIYTILDRNGRRISRHEDNALFVAAIVGRHEKAAGLGSVLSVSKFTKTPANLGKSMTAGGRADVFGIALAETIYVSDGTRRTITRSAAKFDRIKNDHDAIDWNELPAEFHRGAHFVTPHPIVERDEDWIDELPANLGRQRPADQDAITKEFAAVFGTGTPDPALSSKGGAVDFSNMAIKAELKARLKGEGHSAEDFLRSLDEKFGVGPDPRDPETVQRVDELLASLTSDMFVGFAWAAFLARETPNKDGNVTAVRDIAQARRKFILAVD